MLRGLYSAATALSSSQHRHDVTAHNLAHVNVPGYRKIVPVNSSFASELSAAEGSIGGGTVIGENSTDFSSGGVQATGRPLDVAINGDAFFSVSTPEGTMYTRSGSFFLQGDGMLVDQDGNAVLDDGGNEIQLGANTTPSDVLIGPLGQISVNGALNGTLGLTSFEDNSKLSRAGTTLFEASPDAVTVDTTAMVRQGYKEMSNVSSVDEMIQLIVGMRHFEASQKVLTAIDDAISRNTDPRSV